MFRRSVGDTSKQPYFHLSACRRSSRAGIQSAIQGEWVFTRRIEDCAKPPAPGVSQAALLSMPWHFSHDQSTMGAALLRRRPKGLLPAARQELLDPSKVWWGGRRGRLADRPRYSISVSLGVVPLVLPRRGSPSTHRSRGWLRSTRSFRTASAPTQFATRRIRARAWMKQRYWVAPACTSELHHGRGPGTARPFDDAGGDGTQAPPCRRTRPRG